LPIALVVLTVLVAGAIALPKTTVNVSLFQGSSSGQNQG